MWAGCCALVALNLVLGGAACAVDRADTLIIGNVTVLDVRTGTLRGPADIVVVGERITAIAAAGSTRASAARRVDGTGIYAIPGLVDTHAHVTVLRWSRDEHGQLTSRYDRGVSERTLRMLLEWGVTTVRNPAAPTDEGVQLRNDAAAGNILSPRILTAGNALVPDGGERGVRSQVAAQASAGVDYVKLSARLRPELVAAAIDEARKRGVRSVGHLQATTWTHAARLDIDAITHGLPWAPEYLPPVRRSAYRQTLRGRLDWLEWIDPGGPEMRELIATVRERGIPVDPTLIAYHTDYWADQAVYRDSRWNDAIPELREDWGIASFTDDFTPADFERGRRLWPKTLQIIKTYFDAGILLTTGTDLPNPWVVPGISLHQELSLLAAAGIPNADVLRMATLNGAISLGLERELGSIEPGFKADIVLLERNPLLDIENTRSIRGVIAAGRVIYPARR